MTNRDENCQDICVDSFPTSIPDLQFPLKGQNFSSTLSSLKRSTLSTRNRLFSIQHDSHFVQSVASRHHLPLIANERCGSWYIPPEKKAGTAYFKSTDGHFGQWAFSMRRLNLHIFEIIGKAGGCVIVDSTRRGKSMPDALSKTVPLWCTVFNRLLFSESSEKHQMRTPEKAVGFSEHAQIEAKIQGFVEELNSLQLDTTALRKAIKKPLIPSWITPNLEEIASFDGKEYNHIICCTASRRVEGPEASENGYIQGAADDHETWSQGLTASLFWRHNEELLEIAEEDVGNFVRSCRSNGEVQTTTATSTIRIYPTHIYISSLLDETHIQRFDSVVRISSEPISPSPSKSKQPKIGPSILDIQCKLGKLGSRALRTHLSSVVSFLEPIFSSQQSPNILIMCHDGRDLSIGVALAILCLFYDDKGEFKITALSESINKTMIRQRLAKITSAKPDANLSRATLQSVHAFLMP